LARPPHPETVPEFELNRQTITLSNPTAVELVVRIERTAARDDALTAARATTIPKFRELFPGEVLSPGQLMDVASITFLATDLDYDGDLYRDMGEARAFGLLHELLGELDEAARQRGGVVIKIVGEGVLAVFHDAAAAFETAWAMMESPGNPKAPAFPLRIALHHGPTYAATINDRLDYFGSTVRSVWQLLDLGTAGQIMISYAVAARLRHGGRLDALKDRTEIVEARGSCDGPVARVTGVASRRWFRPSDRSQFMGQPSNRAAPAP
jgi:class 3 adenylate cyclase